MTYEWLTDDQIEELVNPDLARRGMATLNLNPASPTCRVLGAWEDGRLIQSFTIQLFPVLGPMLKHDNLHRDNGEVSRTLANKMQEMLDEANARGYMVVADNPVTGRLCERHGMTRVVSPVYVAAAKGIECNDYTGAVQ